jgi:hypothetical protein
MTRQFARTVTLQPLPHFRVGGKILIRQAECDRRIEQFRTGTKTAIDTLVNDVLQKVHLAAT